MSINSEKTGAAAVRSLLFLIIMLVFHLFPPTGEAQEYQIGEGDLLKISVYDNADLTTESRVGGDGKITFPLVGEVEVNGLTTAEAQRKIAVMLQNGFIKKPQVAVFITEYKSKKVTALGEFTKPGIVELRGNATLMEVISNAGGITTNASDNLMIQRKVLKPGNGQKEDVTITVELDKLLEKGNPAANVMVMDGDSIYVPRAAFVYVSGEVKIPGAYKITRGLTVLRSITVAGGFTQRAWKGKTKIIRKTDNGETTISARMEDYVLPDDVIMVPESFF